MNQTANTPGMASTKPAKTQGFTFNHSMIRIKDPKVTLDFYSRIIGMRLLRQQHFDDFSLYFMGFVDDAKLPADEAERKTFVAKLSGVLELTHNHGTEDQADFSYHSGNEEPKGFGHIGFAVPDIDAACERFDKMGVEFQKRPNDGKMKGIAFIKDPDGYWIEIFTPERQPELLKEHLK